MGLDATTISKMKLLWAISAKVEAEEPDAAS